MTDEGKLDLYTERVRSTLNCYAIMRKEVYKILVEMMLIGNECRNVYVTITEEISKISDPYIKGKLSDLLVMMKDYRHDDWHGGGGPRFPGAERNWLQETVAAILNELRTIRKDNQHQDAPVLPLRQIEAVPSRPEAPGHDGCPGYHTPLAS